MSAGDLAVRHSYDTALLFARLVNDALRDCRMERLQTFQEGGLTADDLLARLGQGEPLGTIDFGECLHASASRRSLDFEHVAAQAGGIEFPLQRKGNDMLSALLA